MLNKYPSTAFHQERHLLFRFHAFRNHLELQVVRHADNRPDQHRIAMVGDHIADEVLVDFELIERQTLKIGQGELTRVNSESARAISIRQLAPRHLRRKGKLIS